MLNVLLNDPDLYEYGGLICDVPQSGLVREYHVIPVVLFLESWPIIDVDLAQLDLILPPGYGMVLSRRVLILSRDLNL